MTEELGKPLEMDVREVGSAAVVHVSGSVDMSDAEKMRVTLEDLAAKPTALIVLDLSDMDFICSVGLGAIISAHLKCRHHQGRICLVNPKPAVRELLETTRLTKLFDIYQTVEEATAS